MAEHGIVSRLFLAESCARAAGAIMLQSFTDRAATGATTDFRTKSSPVDPVTDVDEDCEKQIVGMIRSSFPEDAIVAEEAHNDAVQAQLATAGFTWVIDPIDGTRNFIHCLPNVSVCIGLVRAGETVAGIVYAPVFDEMFT